MGANEFIVANSACYDRMRIDIGKPVTDVVMEDVMADGNRHFEHKYFTIRERVELGEVKMYWISGKDNPADIMTKPVDKATIDRLLPYLRGDKEVPLPNGLKIWFGPYCKAEFRANKA